MGRRGENIRKRADGRWEARVVQGRPVLGKTNYKYFYGKSYQEVKQKKKAFLCGLPAPELSISEQSLLGRLQPDGTFPRRILFRDVVCEWLRSKKSSVKESTLACYSNLVKNHIVPTLGRFPADRIDTVMLRDFLLEMKAHGQVRGGGPLSDKTVSDLKSILVQILHYAKSHGMLAVIPECPAVARRQRKTSVFTELEQKRVEAKVLQEDTPFSLGVLISLYGGIRIGEACGLQWKDFDCGNETVSIHKTVSRITATDAQTDSKTKVVINAPKTDCSVRTIPLPTPIFQYFMERRRDGDCYVVTGTTKYMEPRVCLERYKRLLHRAGVAEHTFHALRHTFATRCIENGVDVKSLSEIMGHSDVKITMQRYVHPSMDSKKAQVNKLPCFWASGQMSGQKDAESA